MKILVYTMGKVGSTTVMRALESVGFTAGRAYPGNINTINLNEYDGFITMVRDPVARNISQFFETRADHIRSALDPIYLFLSSFKHYEVLTWFDDWLLPILGVDVYKEPFVRTKGWKTYGNLLVIKTEVLSGGLADALREFTGDYDYVVDHRAKGIEKFHASVGDKYDGFLKSARFSTDFLNTLYDTKHTKHFYTQRQIEALVKRWAK